MHCGVPQGSVLGPLLWNLAYDWVLRGALPAGLHVVCYADDTLVLACGDDYADTADLATEGVELVVDRIQRLGLKVAMHKTEALWFHGPRRRPPPTSLDVGGVQVEVGSRMKYLGLVLDSRWCFLEHFGSLALRVRREIAGLRRLLPNLGGPHDGRRRLYEGVVRSIALYGAPVWADTLRATRKLRVQMRSMQRLVVIGVVRAYRTIAGEAACLLAGSLPWDLVACAHASFYEWRVWAGRPGAGGGSAGGRATVLRRHQLHQEAVELWLTDLAEARVGLRVVEAIRPVLREWMGRRHGGLSFRLVQVLSGHGCFGAYLFRLARREVTASCHECGHDQDTAQHTLEVCPEWDAQRRVLVSIIGGDLSLPAVVRAMVGSDECWQAMASFCEEVMSQKEANERAREDLPDAEPARKRRRGAGRRVYLQHL